MQAFRLDCSIDILCTQEYGRALEDADEKVQLTAQAYDLVRQIVPVLEFFSSVTVLSM